MNVEESLAAAKQASLDCATAPLTLRNDALAQMAYALRVRVDEIIVANDIDMEAARQAQTPEPLLDRLMLDEGRVFAMADALEVLRDLPDPLGIVSLDTVLESGVCLQRISVPLGVVAMVYEARPNVTADAAGICIKTGNACVLRGGSLAFHSNGVLAHILHDAAVEAGMPNNCILALETKDRAATDELLRARGLVDLLIPRGGAGLIAHCVENATVPVIETGVGNCHIYVHNPAQLSMARDIIINAKCQRPGVCNAAETILVDDSCAREVLEAVLPTLHEAGVVLHTDARASSIAVELGIPVVLATQEDWAKEYLDLEIAIKCVSGLEEALQHIASYGTMHSECIITDDAGVAQRFLAQVDAAAVYWNASTRFTDGGMFGLGAEIGISTQKLHARGPFALEALCSYKYVLLGNGQVRS